MHVEEQVGQLYFREEQHFPYGKGYHAITGRCLRLSYYSNVGARYKVCPHHAGLHRAYPVFSSSKRTKLYYQTRYQSRFESPSPQDLSP